MTHQDIEEELDVLTIRYSEAQGRSRSEYCEGLSIIQARCGSIGHVFCQPRDGASFNLVRSEGDPPQQCLICSARGRR